jgi:NitT/TauT family transport system ATP-binding protein
MSRDIQVDQVSMVFYGQGEPVIALEKVDMQVPAGQFASIIGPSGCGKSTLLRLVADVMKPYAGSITLGGDTPRAARHAHSLGFVFQAPTLLPWRSVKQNIELPLDVVGRRSAKRSTRTSADLIELVGLSGFEDALPHQLSGGMQQRVAIAQALILKPPILLMDEAFSALDPGTRTGMQRLIKELWRESGTTIVFVTHNTREALCLGTRVIALAKDSSGERGSSVALDLAVPHLDFDSNEEDIHRLIRQVESATLPAPQSRAETAAVYN